MPEKHYYSRNYWLF